MHATLQAMTQIVPFIHLLTHGEAAVAVVDHERYVAYTPGKTLDLKLSVGQPFKEGSAGDTVVRNKQIFQREIPATVYGYRYVAMGIPVLDENGTAIGGLVAGLPLLLEEELERMATELATAMQEFSATFESIAEIAENTSQVAVEVQQTADLVSTSLKSTGTVTGEIAKIADRTKLLGLNALIEAAHAGQHGSGFAVVAREIQGLADHSIRSTQRVVQVLGEVGQHNGGLEQKVNSLRTDADSLEAAVVQAKDFVDRLTQMAEALQELATRNNK